MRFQFSLATLLVCMTVLAVVVAACTRLPVAETQRVQVGRGLDWGFISIAPTWETREVTRSPGASEAALRIAWSGPLAVAATLATLWTIRRVKSRREIQPSIG
jgi:hypothetical protein